MQNNIKVIFLDFSRILSAFKKLFAKKKKRLKMIEVQANGDTNIRQTDNIVHLPKIS